MTTAGESAGRRLTSPAWSRRGRERPLLPRFVSARAGGIATAAALAAIGLWFVWQASLLDLGDFELPGPGFFPLVLGAVVFICASLLAARTLGVIDARRNRCLRPSRRPDRDRRTVRRAGAVRSPGRAITLGLFGAVLLVVARPRSLCRSLPFQPPPRWWRAGTSFRCARPAAPRRTVLRRNAMSGFDQLVGGFAVALSWKGLLYCFIGCLWGTIVGVLPGLGPLAGMTLLLPLTFGLDPAIGIIMLTGIFYGAMYGGSTTSILVRIPGEAASVVTCIDGYEMARQGRAGPALMISAVGSFIGGTVSILGLMFIAPPLAKVMIAIGPSVEVVLMLLALGVITLVSAGSRLKTALMVVLGLLRRLSRARQSHRRRALHVRQREPRRRTVLHVARHWPVRRLGNPHQSGEDRDHQGDPAQAPRPRAPHGRICATRRRRSAAASIIGFIFGIIPGVSHVVSTFVSYAIEKSFSGSSGGIRARAPSPAWPGRKPPTTPSPAPP